MISSSACVFATIVLWVEVLILVRAVGFDTCPGKTTSQWSMSTASLGDEAPHFDYDESNFLTCPVSKESDGEVSGYLCGSGWLVA